MSFAMAMKAVLGCAGFGFICKAHLEMNRKERLDHLKSENFDVLVVGGGATGAGTALDAVSRGLKVALIDSGDFGGGSSSRSTKLIHGGVRYLELAFKKLDFQQFSLVKDALNERERLLRIAPFLGKSLEIVTPLYSLSDIPYYTAGLKLYDWVARKSSLGKSRFLSSREVIEKCPLVATKGLRGGVSYFDGQFNDARFNILLATTASRLGATVSNYLSLIAFEKQGERIVGAVVRDSLAKEDFVIKARSFVNATGPFADKIRILDHCESEPILSVSSGTHIVVAGSYLRDSGILIPKTLDKRVIFMLPWLNHTLIGTTENASQTAVNPQPLASDFEYLLEQMNPFLQKPLGTDDILAAWTGLRPLVSDKGQSSSRLSRDHYVEVSPSGLVTIVGGKWTTYRLMARDTIDTIVQTHRLAVGGSQTHQILLDGAEGFHWSLVDQIQQKSGISQDSARHIVSHYGTFSLALLEGGPCQKIHPDLPYLLAEVDYSVNHEFVTTPVDFLTRRVRIGFLDDARYRECIRVVASRLSFLFSWNQAEEEEQVRAAYDYFKAFH